MDLLEASAIILITGILAQTAAGVLRVPSILTLLPFGLLVGPGFGLLDPDALFGANLLPFVSFGVAIILFEGGLTLHFSELKDVGAAVRNLVTIGVVAALIVITGLAKWILQVQWGIAALLGAILVVTGPTVIGPILRQSRLGAKLAAVLKWEGILNDAIGAIIAVLVYEALTIPEGTQATHVIVAILKSILLGGGMGFLAASALIILIRFHVIREFMHSSATLGLVIGSYAVSNMLQHESGLVCVTLMGMILANQEFINVKFIVSFKENLTVIFVSSLFIILAARMDFETILQADWRVYIFVASLILIARPFCVWISTIKTELTWRERLFVCFMAPRGIVAAAVISVFSLRLIEQNYEGAESLLPTIFIVILITGFAYSILSRVLAKALGLGADNPQGLLIVGAHRLGRAIAKSLSQSGFEIILADSNWSNFRKSRREGLECYYGNVLNDGIIPDDRLLAVGKILSMTSNDEANSLALLHFAETYERSHLFQLRADGAEDTPNHLRGNSAFGEGEDFEHLMALFNDGATIAVTKLSEKFGYDDFIEKNGEKVVPLFVIKSDTTLSIVGDDATPRVGKEDSIVSLGFH